MNIVLIGFMGSGKTTIGKCLSDMLHMEVVDTDYYIEQNTELSVNEIFDLHGEVYFRDCESQAIKLICQRDNVIISCGGGIVTRQKNIDIMKKNGVVVFLETDPSIIYERLKNDTNRPLLKQNMTLPFISDFLHERYHLYKNSAHITMVTDDKTPQNICTEIINLIPKLLN